MRSLKVWVVIFAVAFGLSCLKREPEQQKEIDDRLVRRCMIQNCTPCRESGNAIRTIEDLIRHGHAEK